MLRRDPDVGLGIVREHGIAAVGVAGAPREIAAGHVDLDAIARAQRVMDVREVDGHPIDRGRVRDGCGARTVHRGTSRARRHPSAAKRGRRGSTSISLATKSVSGQSD